MIAQQVQLTRTIVYLWYDRWLAAPDRLQGTDDVSDSEFRQLIEEMLADQPRPGTPATFTAEQVCQIMALACHSRRGHRQSWLESPSNRALSPRFLRPVWAVF
jgi:putative transposase